MQSCMSSYAIYVQYIPLAFSTPQKNSLIYQIKERKDTSSSMKLYGTLPLLVLCVLVSTNLEVQGQANLCRSTFFSALVQLIPCRGAVAPFSPILPSETCCNAVKALGQPCLCVLVNGPPISGVDRNMAMQLPDKCTANFEPCNMMK